MADPAASGLNREALKKAIDCLHIQDLALQKSQVEVDPDCFLGMDQKNLQVQLKWGARGARLIDATSEGSEEKHRLFVVDMATSIRFVDKSALGSEPPATHRALVDANFVAVYRVQDNADIEPVALDEFATKNVIYHVWPYWREYVSATLARAHLPPFTLPMFKFSASTNPVENANE